MTKDPRNLTDREWREARGAVYPTDKEVGNMTIIRLSKGRYQVGRCHIVWGLWKIDQGFCWAAVPDNDQNHPLFYAETLEEALDMVADAWEIARN